MLCLKFASSKKGLATKRLKKKSLRRPLTQAEILLAAKVHEAIHRKSARPDSIIET